MGSSAIATETSPPNLAQNRQRLRLEIQGLVQGIGFRPFVYGLAREIGVTGWVNNNHQGVVIEIEGASEQLAQFTQRLQSDKPALAQLQAIASQQLPTQQSETFEIHASEDAGRSQPKTALVLPDLSTCPQCLQECFDPSDRRYHYPFTNCTHCGPRLSIIRGLPYDRPLTTMANFEMCPTCEQEYETPTDRRFHAQPNACPTCGPHLELWESQRCVATTTEEAFSRAIAAIQSGKILALKGLGGFQLIVDAVNEDAVERLRQRKHRPDKPFAVMYPSIDAIAQHCQVSKAERDLLRSPAAPIVLLRRHERNADPMAPCAVVAPGNPYLGVMLPYTPIHHWLMRELQRPVIATSGNLSGEPICIDNQDAIAHLESIADVLLVHNRPIERPVDDSMTRVVQDQPIILRRARGYAPLPVGDLASLSPANSYPTILAVGGHLKNTIAFNIQNRIFGSQHLGDLDTPRTLQRLHEAIASFQSLYDLKFDAIACDAHPDYASTQIAQELGQRWQIPVIHVQHHHAHALAGLVDNHLSEPVLSVVWDGTGYGNDGTIWGGEFLQITETRLQRVAHLRPFPLPGGDKAAKEPRRSSLGLLYAALGEESFQHSSTQFSSQELSILKTMLHKGLNTPTTSSMGRLFDAIASLLNLSQRLSFEGQAAMQLEFALEDDSTDEAYPLAIAPRSHATDPWQLDWQPMLTEILADQQRDIPLSHIAAKFHNALVEGLVAIAQTQKIPDVLLSGGCFQNAYLLNRAIDRLRQEGFIPHWHHQIPSNDGGIAVGQVVAAYQALTHSS